VILGTQKSIVDSIGALPSMKAATISKRQPYEIIARLGTALVARK
jgi:hypothetical protein